MTQLPDDAVEAGRLDSVKGTAVVGRTKTGEVGTLYAHGGCVWLGSSGV